MRAPRRLGADDMNLPPERAQHKAGGIYNSGLHQQTPLACCGNTAGTRDRPLGLSFQMSELGFQPERWQESRFRDLLSDS